MYWVKVYKWDPYQREVYAVRTTLSRWELLRLSNKLFELMPGFDEYFWEITNAV